MRAVVGRAGSLALVGGAVCLDFCNTVSGVGTDRRIENLLGVEDLEAWAVHAGVVAQGGVLRLGDADLAEAIAVRTLLQGVFGAVARGEAVGAADLLGFNRRVRASVAGVSVVADGTGFAVAYRDTVGSVDALLNPIVRSSLEVLTGRDVSRIRICPGRHCGWVFLDETKNGSRVWCETQVCGARAKARARYERLKAAGGGGVG